MATIGNTVTGGRNTLRANAAYMHNVSSFHTVIATTQNVNAVNFHSNAFGSDPPNTGKIVEVGLYEISTGTNNLIPATSHFFTLTSAVEWLSFNFAGVTIPPGTYAVGLRGDIDLVSGSDGVYVNNNNIRTTGLPALPDILIGNAPSLNGGAIAAYFDVTPTAVVTDITDVNNNVAVSNGDSVTITGTFGATGNTITVSLNDDVNDPSATTQAITTESATSIDVTVSLPANTLDNGSVFFFVTDSTSQSNANGYSISAVLANVVTAYTVVFTDGFGAPVICESTDFALGMTAYINQGEVNEEVATTVIELSNANSASPQLSVNFSIVPAFGTDTISIVYDDTVGDIKSVTGGIALASQTFVGLVC